MRTGVYYREWDGKNGSHALLARAVRRFLEQKGKTVPAQLNVSSDDKFKKPYLKELPDIHFSISHSGIWWICAVSDEEVGLDIQEQRMCNREKMARRFFHADEVKWLERHGFDYFCRLWAYKESYVKYTGAGLTRGMDYFSAANPDTGVLGVSGVYQTEIPFQKDFWLVLTTESRPDFCLYEFR